MGERKLNIPEKLTVFEISYECAGISPGSPGKSTTYNPHIIVKTVPKIPRSDTTYCLEHDNWATICGVTVINKNIRSTCDDTTIET